MSAERSSLAGVAMDRARLWNAGYFPIALQTRGKRPLDKQWPEAARRDPPDAVVRPPSPRTLNTGVLADGLRAIDIDIEDHNIAARIEAEAIHRFGPAPVRRRGNSCRRLLLYRAAIGEPGKIR